MEARSRSEEREMIQAGDTVQVIVTGKFNGQIVKVLSVDRRRMRGKEKRSYKLETKWDDLPYPAYFREDEIRKIEVSV